MWFLTAAQNPPPPPYTMYSVYVYTLYIIQARGRGAGELSQREGESGNGNTGEYRSQSWIKNTIMTECTQDIGYLQSINSVKHLPQGPFTGQFLYDNILHCLL
jgi:hypothetical protein